MKYTNSKECPLNITLQVYIFKICFSFINNIRELLQIKEKKQNELQDI